MDSASATDGAANPVKVLWLRQPGRRIEEDISFAGRGRFCGRRGRDRRPALQGNPYRPDLSRDSGHGVQRSGADDSTLAGLEEPASGFSHEALASLSFSHLWLRTLTLGGARRDTFFLLCC